MAHQNGNYHNTSNDHADIDDDENEPLHHEHHHSQDVVEANALDLMDCFSLDDCARIFADSQGSGGANSANSDTLEELLNGNSSGDMKMSAELDRLFQEEGDDGMMASDDNLGLSMTPATTTTMTTM
eukprot:CAMPEP_0196140346 /NCGR_PEP_ID=MMETSP0910-20130528/7287_1 /TAXON_ID=49265 /ORGANISM="Thalassiosira rotula, Strain GSO102" /LENGTH=126 /DNA_ID=CAMNT_0041401195 /DNA_START=83 /DNA_END=460 /DNA_ORIENTATION=+